MASTRPSIIGKDSGPEAPYPRFMEGEVIKGFGRGSKEVSVSLLFPFCPLLLFLLTRQDVENANTIIPARHPNSKHPSRPLRNTLDQRRPLRSLLRLGIHQNNRPLLLLHNFPNPTSTLRPTARNLPNGNVNRLQPLLQKHSPLRRSAHSQLLPTRFLRRTYETTYFGLHSRREGL
jgi:hypothetical protein